MESLGNNQLSQATSKWPGHMQRALSVAVNVINTAPNPRVGCVLVNAGVIVGEGWHTAAGQAHAEVMALDKAGNKALGATVFVSLEPCAHQGRTGPCARALVAAGVTTVVIAAIDPNPEVAGQGVKILEAAGIDVVHLLDFQLAARRINPGYFKRRESGLPYVRCKMAMSIDGRTALANGESQWITGKAARSDVQLLRASSSAVLTGIETIIVDDPTLNVRVAELSLSEQELEQNKLALATQPLRVILDSNLRTPGTAKIFRAEGAVKLYTIARRDIDYTPAENVEIIVTEKSEECAERVNLVSVLESLAFDYSCNEVLIEAGPTLSAAFITAGLVDELIVYIAPKLLGSDAKALFNLAGIQSMSDVPVFDIGQLEKIGKDIKVTLLPSQ